MSKHQASFAEVCTEHATRVVVRKSFSQVRPKHCPSSVHAVVGSVPRQRRPAAQIAAKHGASSFPQIGLERSPPVELGAVGAYVAVLAEIRAKCAAFPFFVARQPVTTVVTEVIKAVQRSRVGFGTRHRR